MFKSTYDWQVTNLTDEDLANISHFADELEQNQLVIKILYLRGYSTLDKLNALFSEQSELNDPFLMHDMEKMINRLQTAVENNEHILVYGDYDADGITSTSIMYEALEMIGAQVTYYVPNRFEDGYGPNLDIYKYFINQGIQLIVTVDNGVAGFEAIEYAMDEGVDVLVTDHHEIQETLPKAYSIVHPRHPEGNYPFGELAGAGVAFKVVQALLGEVPIEFLDLAAIGTVADLVSLTGENRQLVTAGLQQLQHTERLGLQMFFEKEHVDTTSINEETIGFVIAPRLNALGRMGDPTPGVKLLTSFDSDEIMNYLELIEETNNLRKAEVERISNDVDQKLQSLQDIPPIIVLSDSNWHQGVLGIVASRVVEKYHRPTILLAKLEAESVYKGSARSITGIDMFALLTEVKQYAKAFGGHEMAAGMTITEDQYSQWADHLLNAMSSYESIINAKEPLEVTTEINLDQVSLTQIKALKTLQPFGTDWAKPRFLLKNIDIQSARRLGKDKQTLKLMLTNNQEDSVAAIGFKKGEWMDQLSTDAPIDLVVELSINHWNGVDTPQVIIQDILQVAPALYDLRQSTSRQRIFSIENALYVCDNPQYLEAYTREIPSSSEWRLTSDAELESVAATKENLVIFDCILAIDKIKQVIKNSAVANIYLFAYTAHSAYLSGMPTREDFAKLFKYLNSHPDIPLKGQEAKLAKFLNLPPYRFQKMMQTFVELGIVKWENNHCLIQPISEKKDLLASDTMKKFHSQITAERFLLYNDSEEIKEYFFQEEKS